MILSRLSLCSLAVCLLAHGVLIDSNQEEKSCHNTLASPEQLMADAQAKRLSKSVKRSTSVDAFWKSIAESREFVETFWQERPVLLQGAVPAGILTWSEVRDKEGFLVTSAPANKRGHLESFSTEEARPGQSVAKKVAAGHTALIGYEDPQLCSRATEHLGMPCSTTVYATGANRAGVPAHWDENELFVMQAEGSKTWTLYQQHVQKATAHLLGGHNGHVISRDLLVELMTVQLQPGDVLYVPRGVPHATRTPKSLNHERDAVSLSLSWSIATERSAYYNLLICARHRQESDAMEGRRMLYWTVRRALAEHEDILAAAAEHRQLRRLVPAGFEAKGLGLESTKQRRQAIMREALDLNRLLDRKVNRSHIAAASTLWANTSTVTDTEMLCKQCGRCPQVPHGIFNVSTGEGDALPEQADSDSPGMLGQLPNQTRLRAKATAVELLRHASITDCRDGYETLRDATRLEPRNETVLKTFTDYVWRKAKGCKAEVCGNSTCVHTFKWRRAAHEAIQQVTRWYPDDDNALVMQAGLIAASAQDRQSILPIDQSPIKVAANLLENASAKGGLWGSRAALMRAYLLHDGLNESRAAVQTLEPYLKGDDAELLSAFGFIMGVTGLGSPGAVRYCWSRAHQFDPDSPATIYADSMFQKVVTLKDARKVFMMRRDMLFNPGAIPQLGEQPPKLPPASLNFEGKERQTKPFALRPPEAAPPVLPSGNPRKRRRKKARKA